MTRLRSWLVGWLEHRRIPIPLRQCTWCQNGLHSQCSGWTGRDAQTVADCLCPCPRALEHRARP